MIEIDVLPASSEKKSADAILLRIGSFSYADHISELLQLLENRSIEISRTFIHDLWNHKNELLIRSEDGRRTINSIDSRLNENLAILSETLDLLDERKINNEIFGVSDSNRFGLFKLGLYVLGPSKAEFKSHFSVEYQKRLSVLNI